MTDPSKTRSADSPDAPRADAPAAEPYRQIFERNPRPMWVYDAVTLLILAVNEAAVAQYGYTAEEFTRLTIRDLRTPAERARLDRYIARRPSGLANAGAWRHQRKDGTVIDVEIMSHDIDWQGRAARVVTAYDATPRQRRRLEVESAVASLSARVTAGPDSDLGPALRSVAAVLGASRAYLMVGDAEGRALRWAGCWPDAPGAAWPDLGVLCDWVRDGRGDQAVVIVDANAVDEADGVRTLLAEHDVGSVLAVPIRRGDGALLGALGFDHRQPGHSWSDEDVRALRLAAGAIGTELERRRAIQALRASEERLRLLLGQLPAVLWTTDAALRVTALQGAYAEVAPSSPGEEAPAGGESTPLLEPGAPLLGVLGVSDDHDAVLDAHRRALAGVVVTIDWLTDGRWMEGRIEPLESETGAVIGTIGIALDVTERRHLEDQLRYSQRMEAVGRLAGGVAHDFNNILTSITGHAGFLLDALPADDPRRADADEIRLAAERAAAVTRQLLVYARRQVIQPTVLDLGAVLVAMRGMLRPLLGETYALRTHAAADLGAVVADRGQIEQVIMNLVLNARDAMPDGGEIDVEVGNAVLDEEDTRRHAYVTPGDYVRLAVSDTGVGMPPELQEHAFEPFFTTKSAGRGTGLGLSTVYAIVKHAGGYVWLHSTPNRGTVVEVLLPRGGAPLPEPAPASDPAAAEPAPNGARGGETIVLVEDEQSVRSIVRRMLEGHGYRVLTAEDGEQALALCASYEGEIDLLVTDVVMPGLSGREVADRLETMRPGMRTLFMSGYTADEIIRRGIVTDEIAFIEKPFSPAQLLARIGEVLTRKDGG